MTKRTPSNLALAAALLLGASVLVPVALPAQGTLDPLLQYQGVLRDADGAPIDGDVEVTFMLFDTDDPSGATALWEESHELTLSGGLVSTILGQTSALDPELFHGKTLWLGIDVEDEGVLLPMQQMLPSAQALYADHAGNADQLEGHTADDFMRTQGPTSVSTHVRAPTLSVEHTVEDGIALQVEGISEFDGKVVADSFHHTEPRTYYYRLTPMDFSPSDTITDYVASPHSAGLYALDFENAFFTQSFHAPVRLPANAIITGFRAYLEDSTEDDYLEVRLGRSHPASPSWVILASVSSEDLNGDNWVETSSISDDGTYDPAAQQLLVRVRAGSWNWAESGEDLRLHGVRITYTLEEIP